jgi:hypothetical protein
MESTTVGPASSLAGTVLGATDMAIQTDHEVEVESTEAAESGAWDRFFRVFFRTTPHRLMRGVRKVSAGSPIEELVVVGRKTGKERHHLVSLLDVDGRLYVGHPNHRSQWARNLEVGGGVLLRRGFEPTRVRAIWLDPGPERSAAIAAAGRQPFPAGPLYSAARRHIEAVGAYYRLEPTEPT